MFGLRAEFAGLDDGHGPDDLLNLVIEIKGYPNRNKLGQA